MTRKVSYNAKNAFNDIWNRHPELQNWSSSSWWFFLLLPKQKLGYGPKQMMFSFASRSGKLVSVNSTWQKGMDTNQKKGKIDEFMSTVVGWIYTGKQVYEEVVHQPVKVKLSYEGQYLEGWTEQDDETLHGGRIEKSNSREYAIDVQFVGKKGNAKFKIWNPGSSPVENPQIIDFRIPGKLGGATYVSWKKIEFEGEFTSPEGKEQLSGLGYFQRVLLNIPMFPWKWFFLIFEDGSIFSSSIFYFGLQNFRRGNKFFRQSLERAVIHFYSRAYFFDNTSKNIIKFKKVNIYHEVNKTEHPTFYLKCFSEDGDFIKLKLESHAHAGFLLERRVIKHIWQTKYHYNEFMLKLQGIRGQINGEKIDREKYGTAWGNMEYTWGMSL